MSNRKRTRKMDALVQASTLALGDLLKLENDGSLTVSQMQTAIDLYDALADLGEDVSDHKSAVAAMRLAGRDSELDEDEELDDDY